MIVQSDIISVFRTILIIVAVYYTARFFFRVVFPWVIKWWLNRVVSRMQSQQSQSDFEQTSRDETGRVSISTDKRRDSNSGQSGGEYIDFEEV